MLSEEKPPKVAGLKGVIITTVIEEEVDVETGALVQGT